MVEEKEIKPNSNQTNDKNGKRINVFDSNRKQDTKTMVNVSRDGAKETVLDVHCAMNKRMQI